ncbi:MAG: AraC family transcriptional regulator [Lachnospiraceae bacterium]
MPSSPIVQVPSTRTFCAVFKKITGMTPESYRSS